MPAAKVRGSIPLAVFVGAIHIDHPASGCVPLDQLVTMPSKWSIVGGEQSG